MLLLSILCRSPCYEEELLPYSFTKLGHRVEADRQKRDEDGKTLTDKIDQPDLSKFHFSH